MSLKFKCYSNWNMTQVVMWLKLECHFNWNVTQTGMQTLKTNSMNSAEYNLFFWFSVKLVDFSAKFGFFDSQVRINFQNVILIHCKWCKICKYYVNSMVISCSTLSCCNVKFVALFRQICIPKIAGFTKKVFSKSAGILLKLEGHSNLNVTQEGRLDR